MPYAERTIASAAIVIGALRVKYKTHCLHRRITQRIDLSAKAHQGRKLKNFLLIFIFVNDTYNTSKYRSPNRRKKYRNFWPVPAYITSPGVRELGHPEMRFNLPLQKKKDKLRGGGGSMI